MSDITISGEMEDYLYSFIVDTNREHDLINSIEGNNRLKEKFKQWFQVEE